MMITRLHVFSITNFFCCVFVPIFLINNTIVSLQFPLPEQIEILLAFKNEFPSPTCNHTVLNSWTRSTPQNSTNSFDGVVFDNKTGVVTNLHLDDACLRGTIEPNSSLFKFHHLRYLDLSYNNFDLSSFPSEFGRLANLEVLNFRYVGLVGEVPSSIQNLSRLTFLDLSNNKLRGGFPLVYNLTKLSFLDLSNNNFSGTIPTSLFTMPSLLGLDLSQNHLREPLENLNSSSSSKLKTLYLGRNLFSGRILEPISRLVKLTYLDLSFLTILNPINIAFLPLKSLEYLDLSGNTLSRLNTTSSDHALTNLIGLYLSSCSLVEFPEILKTLPNLQELDISNNRLKGKVPGWLWDLPLTKVSLSNNSLDGFEGSREVVLPSSLVMLDLSSNAFEGPFPILPPTIDSLIASENNFTGDLPLSLCNPRKLTVLDLSHNSFSGPIPQCLSDLVEGILNLRHNNLNGMLPDIFCRSGSSLITLDVSKNQITGKLPRSLANCNRLKLLNVENNMITDTFPFWLKALPLLQVIVLGSNRFYGSISSPQDDPLSFSKLQIIDISRNNFNGSLPPNYFLNWSSATSFEDHGRRRQENQMNGFHGRRRNMDFLKMLTPYTAIDFSGNRLGGQIPESIGVLKSLVALNLSNNVFACQIPLSMAKLTELESLDLSRNQLSGNIPQELTNLSFLAILNMSYNKLTGQIPQGRQFNTFTESSFEGNINLCGPPLQKSCSGAAHDLNSKAATIDYWPTLILMMLFFGLGIGHDVIAAYIPTLFI